MTTGMVRKQIYIHKRQVSLLKRLAHQRGVSEAEVIRQAIDHEASEESFQYPVEDSHTAMEEILRFVEERTMPGITGEPYTWNRAELYEERENRWVHEQKPDQQMSQG